MLKFIKNIVIIISLLSITLFLGGLYLVENPEVLINSKSLALVSKYLSTDGIFVRWNKLDIEVRKKQFLTYELNVRGSGIKVDTFDLMFSSSIADLNLNGIVQFGLGYPTVQFLDVPKMEFDYVKINQKNSSGGSRDREDPKEDDTNDNSLVPDLFKNTSIGRVSLGVNRFEICEDKRCWITNGTFKRRSQEPVTIAQIFRTKNELEFHVSTQYARIQDQISISVAGNVGGDEIEGKVFGKAKLPSYHVRNVLVKECMFSLKGDLLGKLPEAIQMDCPFQVILDPKWIDPSFRKNISRDFDFRLTSNLNRLSSNPLGEVHLKMKPIQTSIFKGEAELKVRPRGNTFEIANLKSWYTEVFLGLEIPHFEKLVQYTEDTPFAIPAPLSSLQGKIKTQVLAKGSSDQIQVNYNISTQLSSDKQSLVTNGKGKLDLILADGTVKSADHEVQVNLLSVKVAVPPLDLTHPPRLSQDSRIQKGTSAPQSLASSLVKSRILIRTPANSPVLLLNSWSEQPLPIFLNLDLENSDALDGVIQFGKCRANLFKRPVTIEKFNLKFAPTLKDSSVDGLIVVDYTDYKISIEILDTIKKPRVKIHSEPYLSEDQAIAALLFGHPIEELDSDQVADIGDTRAALANRAMDLGTLYFLASTPVQSVNFDPETKVVTARVRLGGGTSLGIGADSNELKTIGIRKRLGHRWAIEADLNNPVSSERANISTFLQWSYRH